MTQMRFCVLDRPRKRLIHYSSVHSPDFMDRPRKRLNPCVISVLCHFGSFYCMYIVL